MRILMISAVLFLASCANLQQNHETFLKTCLEQWNLVECTAIEYYNAENALTETVEQRYDAGLIHRDQKEYYLDRADEANAIVDEAVALGNVADIQGQTTALEALERVLIELEK